MTGYEPGPRRGGARSASHGMMVRFDRVLGAEAEAAGAGQSGQRIVEGSKVHRETVFFHGSSKTLILTDLMESFEPRNLPWWMRILAKAAKITDPGGQIHPMYKQHFAGNVAELRRAFRFVL